MIGFSLYIDIREAYILSGNVMKPIFKLPLIFASIALFFLQPVFVRMLTTDELGLNIYTALFGVLITAFITYILLQGQAQQQQEVEKSAKAYAEKLSLFKNFFRDLIKISDNYRTTREIKQSEINGLIVLFSKISIHLDTEKLHEVSKILDIIFGTFNEIQNEKKTADTSRSKQNEQTISRSLIEIANIFRKELYGDNQGHPQKDKKAKPIMNFIQKVFRGTKKEQSDLDDIIRIFEKLEGTVDSDNNSGADDVQERLGVFSAKNTGDGINIANNIAEKDCSSQKQTGGVVDKIMDAQQCITALLDFAHDNFFALFQQSHGWNEEPEKIHTLNALYARCRADIKNMSIVMIGFDADGEAEGPFFQCHLEFEDDELRRACYLAMRREFGGRINKWCWWMPFPKEKALLIRTNPTDTELRKYITATIGRVYQWVLGYKKMMMLYNRYNSEILQNNEGWRPGIWANYVWNFFHSTSPLYLDIDYAEDSTELRIWITNNNHNTEELKEQLAKVLPDEKYNAPNNKEPYFHLYKEHLTEETIVKELQALLPKLAACGK